MNFLKLINTIRYLRQKQVFYRLYYLARKKFGNTAYNKPLIKEIEPLKWNDPVFFADSFFLEKTFCFLNVSHQFQGQIDWNYSGFGKLWTYNLNYFDFLNQKSITTKKGLDLIKDYMETKKQLQDGLEPYPISLRGINWIKFLSRNQIKDHAINETLYKHYQRLYHNLEYHLLGNHLLENGFSLFFGAYYFKDEQLYQKVESILKTELEEQVLNDGAHFELSPMYHQILLHRLPDCINLAQSNPWRSDRLLPLLKEKVVKMLSWLQTATFSNGNIPMVNDSAYEIAPSSQTLFNYAKELGINWKSGRLDDSGYRKFERTNFEVFMDVGNIGPDYQLGHAHSDTFSFELYVDQKPILVDTGTSTYEKNQLRQKERETAAHNTVKIGNREQTQVWGGFRVGKRAKVVELEEGDSYIKASHNGYYPTLHEREFRIEDSGFKIIDSIKNQKECAVAHFHFHPSIINIEQEEDSVILQTEGIVIFFKGEGIKVSNQSCHIAEGFNIRRSAIKIEVSFNQTLETTIRKVNR